MATIQRVQHSSQPTSLAGSIPGDAATGHLLRDIAGWVDNLAPQNTPIYQLIKTGRPGTQAKLEWGSGANLPHSADLGAGIAAGATTLTVVAGQGARFQKYMKLAVYDMDVNGYPNFATKEEMWVSGEPAADTLTVVRGRGTTTARAFAAGARIEIIGVALPEGQDFTVSADVYGDWLFNYYQGFEKMAALTEEAENTPDAEFGAAGKMARLVRDRTQRLKLEIEKGMVQGSRNAGNLSTPTPSEMGGFVSFIPSANTTNLNGNPLTIRDIDNEGRELWESVGDAGAKRLLMNMDTVTMFDAIPNRYRSATMDDTTIDLRLERVRLRTGDYEIVPTRWIPAGVIVGVNFDNITRIPYKGMDWKEKEVPTDGPYRKRAIYGRFSLRVESPETMFLIFGFDTNLNNYSGTI